MIQAILLVNEELIRTVLDTLSAEILLSTLSIGVLIGTAQIYRSQRDIMKRQKEIMSRQAEAERTAQLPSVQSLRMQAIDENDLSVELSNSGGGAAENMNAVIKLETSSDISTTFGPRRTFMTRHFKSNQESSAEWTPTMGTKLASGEQDVSFKIVCSFHPRDGDSKRRTFTGACDLLADDLKTHQISQLADELSESDREGLSGNTKRVVLDAIESYTDDDKVTAEASLTDIETFYRDCKQADKIDTSSLDITDDARLRIDAVYKDMFGEWEEEPIADITFSIGAVESIGDILDPALQTPRLHADPSGHAQAMDRTDTAR